MYEKFDEQLVKEIYDLHINVEYYFGFYAVVEYCILRNFSHIP